MLCVPTPSVPTALPSKGLCLGNLYYSSMTLHYSSQESVMDLDLRSKEAYARYPVFASYCVCVVAPLCTYIHTYMYLLVFLCIADTVKSVG